jgi:hypothetical protein
MQKNNGYLLEKFLAQLRLVMERNAPPSEQRRVGSVTEPSGSVSERRPVSDVFSSGTSQAQSLRLARLDLVAWATHEALRLSVAGVQSRDNERRLAYATVRGWSKPKEPGPSQGRQSDGNSGPWWITEAGLGTMAPENVDFRTEGTLRSARIQRTPRVSVASDAASIRFYSSGHERFSLCSYDGGSGTVLVETQSHQGWGLPEGPGGKVSWAFVPGERCYRINGFPSPLSETTPAIAGTRWNGTFTFKHAAAPAISLVPVLPVRPPRWMGFEVSDMTEALDEVDLWPEANSGVLGILRSGTAYPRHWVLAAARRWNPVGDLSWTAEDISGHLRAGTVAVFGCWVKMGRLGVLGPPIPKTFLSVWLPGELLGRKAGGVTHLAFYKLPRPLGVSSYVRFPVWEARACGRGVAVTLRFEFGNLHQFQEQLPEPEEAGTFEACTPFASGTMWVERKVRGRFVLVASYTTSQGYLEFGSREGLPYLPLYRTEWIWGSEHA